MAQKISTDDELEDLLDSLGETAEEVAATLAAAGIEGRRENAQCCPVAMWLRRETGTPHVHVDGALVKVGLGGPGFPHVQIDTPHAINRFVGAFDHHQYPDLDERPVRRSWPNDFD